MFNELLTLSPDAVVLADAQGHIVELNRPAEEMFGFQQNELLGQPVEILIPERFRSQHPAHRNHYMARSHTRPMGAGLQLYGLRKNGTEFPVDIMLSPVDGPAGKLVVSVIRDVSEQRRAQEALRKSEQQLEKLFEFSPDGILVTDPQGRITKANAQIEQAFGYGRSQLVGQAVEILIPERFRNGHPDHQKKYTAHPRLRPMGAGLQLFGRRKDGSEFPVDIMLNPVDLADGQMVLAVVRDVTEQKKALDALREKEYLEEELNTEHHFDDIIGESTGLRQVLKQVETVAPTEATVLIEGETGTGKELIARAVHRLSKRHERSFIKLNCAAIPSGLLESELFGHEKGAFTGAIAQKIGRLELADQGTLFLDEIGELPLDLQPKLLRALQEKEIERVGGTRTILVNVRLVAATNRNLREMVAAKQFRSDLYYRLHVFPLFVPPLRQRREDIPLLVRYFVDNHARKLGRTIETIPQEVMDALSEWSWPGNIRELENFIERAVILTRETTLRAPLAELEIAESSNNDQPTASGSTLESAERELILRVLRETKEIGGPQGAAAKLGLKRTTLNSKLKKLGISRRDYI
jgi:PAS domain S-box-containing protein